MIGKRAVPVALILLLAAACLRVDLAPRFTPAWEPFQPTGEGWITSRPVLLIADCQVHNLYSKSLPERNLSAEAAAGTAIRPPQLDLFSPEVLSWIVRNGAPEAVAILHLGDALDLGCEGEFDTFLEVMSGAGKPWFMAPGNHDFFYLGTYDPQNTGVWEDACHGAGRMLTKDLFIRLYVAALLAQDDAGCVALAEALELADQREAPRAELAERLPLAFEWHAAPGSTGFLADIAWSIDAEAPWRSFILQGIDGGGRAVTAGGAGPVRALLLDSCQYRRRPELVPNGWQSYPLALNCGFTGEMLPDQLRRIRAWVETGGKSFLFMFHHPFDALAPRTRASLGWLWRERPVGLMVTAHTHRGYYAHHDLGGELDQLELNLASTTDWPMEWRTLVGHVNHDERKLYIQSKRYTLVDTLMNREGYFRLDWEIPLDAPDDYRKYKQGRPASGVMLSFALYHHWVPYWLPQPRVRPNAAARETEESVKDTMLWTYFRLLQQFPTDSSAKQPQWPAGCENDQAVVNQIVALGGEKKALEKKIAFLQELEAFERSRASRDPETGAPNDDVRARFKISQAAWASRFEKSQGRRLSVEDELIRVDWDKAVQRAQQMSDQ